MRLDDSNKLTALILREKLATDIVVKYATPTNPSRYRKGGQENNKLCSETTNYVQNNELCREHP